MKKTYYIYHIPGKKIGVTSNLDKRAEQLGMTDLWVLETSNDIDHVSQREIELQKKFGYRTDGRTYKETVEYRMKQKQMRKEMEELLNLHATNLTLTFPVDKDNVATYLKSRIGSSIKTHLGSYYLDDRLVDWITKNSTESLYKDMGCYVYVDALHSYALRATFKSSAPKESYSHLSTFDKIRNWAEERGIYAKGDSKTQYLKLMEESGELARAILKRDKAEVIDAIGDMVVVLTNLAHLEGLTIEQCIDSAYNVIANRKGKMINGTFVKQETL